jgi:hypothetical protein
MSFYTGTQSEVLFAGPPAAGYSLTGASTASQFLAFLGSTGDFQQPLFPGGFWQQGRTGQLASFEIYGICSTGASITLALTLTLNTASGVVAGSVLTTFPTVTLATVTNIPFMLRGVILNRGSGYGTSSVATNLWTSAEYVFNQETSITAANISGAVAPTQLATTDFSVNQWLMLNGTFGSSNAGNQVTVNTVVLRGEN